MPTYHHATIIGVILISAGAFVVEQSSHADFAQGAGAVPAVIVGAARELTDGMPNVDSVRQLSRLATAIFLHGSPEHLVYNMVFLWTFGYLTSQILGQWWALAILVVGGMAGNVLQVCLNLNSMVPIIGASGGVCALGAAYLGLALRWQLPWPDVWPLAHPIPPLQLAAFAVLGFIGDMYFLTTGDQHNIAYGAHVGGFIAGFAIAIAVTSRYSTRAQFESASRR